MKVYGLIGYPLTHSFSKKYFSEKFNELEFKGKFDYRNFELNSVNEFIPLIQNNSDLHGLNVTAPYKKSIIPFLDDLTYEATATQAVNCISVFRNNDGTLSRLTGHNTDVTGFKQSIEPLLLISHCGALILGTGGASNAVKRVFELLNIPVQMVSRLKKDTTILYSQIDTDTLRKYPIIVNTTPLGTFPEIDTSPPLPYQLLTASNLLFDLVYNPPETQFILKGKSAGATVQNGLLMLEKQAEASWEIWNK